MKKILLLIVLVFSVNCFSQTIVPMYKTSRDQSGVYYKDTFNDLDKLVGTWKYTNGSTSLTIVLQKKLQKTIYNTDTYYDRDFIVGGYRYIENGVEKINTLSQLTEDLDYVFSYYIAGSVIAGPDSVYCLNCGPSDRVILAEFTDPTRSIEGYEPEMLFKRVDSGGIQKLELNFRTIFGGWEEEGVDPGFTQYTVPFGEYILIKQ